jgi:serine/threonine protein kinase/tetratricopeptide (TPR) repeat protein
MTERPVSEKTIFEAAIEIASLGERAAYLAEACGSDQRLRADVEALLAAHDRLGTIGLAAGSPAANEAVSERPGAVIGSYKLMEQIGEGGMGLVFVAEQQHPVRRKVALKVIKPGMDTRQVVARFEAERQALALMDHANIARVLDGGETGSGRPYFVMELVRGVPVTQYCDENRLSPRERLELFVDVCQAVQHAHHKGIIHRDIKPSNVLVSSHDDKPVVKVIDFGVAKAVGQQLTDKTVYTHFAQLIGTPLYMSPEQAGESGLDVDTRTDIYSLGVLLYELLTGTTPFDKKRFKEAGYDEMRRIIREEEPPKPSTRISTLGQAATTLSTQRKCDPRRLSQLFRGELDWIVMRALEKDRNRRYETSSAFAADVQRYLHDEPVLACPPSVSYRLRKFGRRHKGKISTAVAMLLLLVVGTAVSTWQAVRATRAEHVTKDALAQVTAEQAKTQTALEAETAAKTRTREALDLLTDNVVEKMFAKQPELDEAEKAFLRKVLGFYEAFTKEAGETAEARFLRAKGFFVVARMHALLGDRDQGVAGYRQAAQLLEQLTKEHPDVPEYAEKLGRTHDRLGRLLAELGNPEDADRSFRAALNIKRKLAKNFPKELSYRRSLAGAYLNLGYFLRMQKNYVEAKEACQQALDWHGKVLTESDRAEDRQALERSRTNLAGLLREQHQYAKAEQLYRQALAVMQKHQAKFPTVLQLRRELADCYHGLAIALAEQRKNDEEAEADFRQALDIREKLMKDYPSLAQYRRELGNIANDLGVFLYRLKKYADAEKALGQAVELKEELAAKPDAVLLDRLDFAKSYDCLGDVRSAAGRPEDAESAWNAALPVWEKLAADSSKDPHIHKSLAGILVKLAILHHQRKDFAAALPLLERAQLRLKVALKVAPDNPTSRLYYRNRLRLEADNCLGRADHVRLAATANELARFAYDAANDAYDAAGLFCACAAMAEKDNHPDEVEHYAKRVLALLRLAVARGFKDVDRMKKDSRFGPLREREEFKKLLVDLEGKAKV